MNEHSYVLIIFFFNQEVSHIWPIDFGFITLL